MLLNSFHAGALAIPFKVTIHPQCRKEFFVMAKSKSKEAKIEGLKKHKEMERAKKQATKDRKNVSLPKSYKKK